MHYVMSLTKDMSVLQYKGEIPELFSWKTTSVCSKFSAVTAQLLLLHRCLNQGFLCNCTERDGSQSNMSDSCPVSMSSNSPLLDVGLISFRLVPMGFSAYKSTS